MEIKKIQEADVKNKRVLLRVDFNVSVEKEEAREKFKIAACQESVDYLLSQGAKVAMLTWLGRPGGKIDPKFSLEPIRDDVEEIIGHKVKFVQDCIGENVKKALDELGPDEVILLENVRFYAGEGDIEKKQSYDAKFAQQLSDGFDVFINDAISVCHRDQASTSGVAKFLPSFSGFRLQKEIENLDRIKENPAHPAVAIVGGAKIETKLPIINNFEKNYDSILVGGMVANEAIDKKLSFESEIILPVDFAKDRMDIGEQTIEEFKKIISTAETIVWNGPMGKFEEPPYDHGTKEILKAVIESGAFTLMGGGESVELLERENVMDKISFVSTGGGAMLDYIAGNPMPGIEALKK